VRSYLKVGSHDNFRRSPRYKILYQATGVSTGKISSRNAVILLALHFLVSTCVISPCPRNLFFQRHDLGIAHALALSCHVVLIIIIMSIVILIMKSLIINNNK
jgi:hypothetical protein